MGRNNRIFEIGVSGFLFIATLYLFYIAITTVNKFPNQGMGSMDFPKIFFAIQMVLCLFIFAKSVRGYLNSNEVAPKTKMEEEESLIKTQVLISIVLTIAYAICWNLIGYLLSTFLFVVAESRVLDNSKSFWRSLVFASFVAVFTYIVFGLLFQVSFPEPLLDLLFG